MYSSFTYSHRLQCGHTGEIPASLAPTNPRASSVRTLSLQNIIYNSRQKWLNATRLNKNPAMTFHFIYIRFKFLQRPVCSGPHFSL